MQVERESGFGHEYSGERVSNTWMTYPEVGDNSRKLGLIPHKLRELRFEEESWPLHVSWRFWMGPRLISLLVG